MKSHRNPLIYLAFLLLFLVGRFCYTPSVPVEAILEDEAQVSQASVTTKALPPRQHPPLGLVWPLPEHKPGRGYGRVRAAFDRTRWTFHNGVDVRAKTGTPIRAAGDGKVFRARWMGACGNGIILVHKHQIHQRVTTTYCHLNKFDVLEGQDVEVSQKIGEVGSTGRSTTPHLHLAVHINGKHTEPTRNFVEIPK